SGIRARPRWRAPAAPGASAWRVAQQVRPGAGGGAGGSPAPQPALALDEAAYPPAAQATPPATTRSPHASGQAGRSPPPRPPAPAAVGVRVLARPVRRGRPPPAAGKPPAGTVSRHPYRRIRSDWRCTAIEAA